MQKKIGGHIRTQRPKISIKIDTFIFSYPELRVKQERKSDAPFFGKTDHCATLTPTIPTSAPYSWA